MVLCLGITHGNLSHSPSSSHVIIALIRLREIEDKAGNYEVFVLEN